MINVFIVISCLLGISYDLLIKKHLKDGRILVRKDVKNLPITWRFFKIDDFFSAPILQAFLIHITTVRQEMKRSWIFKALVWIESIIPIVVLICLLEWIITTITGYYLTQIRGILMGLVAITNLILLLTSLFIHKVSFDNYQDVKAKDITWLLLFFNPIILVVSSFYILLLLVFKLFNDHKKPEEIVTKNETHPSK